MLDGGVTAFPIVTKEEPPSTLALLMDMPYTECRSSYILLLFVKPVEVCLGPYSMIKVIGKTLIGS